MVARPCCSQSRCDLQSSETKSSFQMKKGRNPTRSPTFQDLMLMLSGVTPDGLMVIATSPSGQASKPISDSEPICHRDWSQFSRCRIKHTTGSYPLTLCARRLVHRMWSGQWTLHHVYGRLRRACTVRQLRSLIVGSCCVPIPP